MQLSALTATSPIDGRYRNKTEELDIFFSEFGLIKYRVRVEIEYFIALCKVPLPQLSHFDSALFPKLRAIYQNFTPEDALQIKNIEKTTNHDVKAVEYFIKKQFESLQISEFQEFVHFGLTSQDINNTAVPLSIKEVMEQSYLPFLQKTITALREKANDYANIPMLAKTHGQPASPTVLGKEFGVFVNRLEEQVKLLEQIPFAAKFGGATGNFNAHFVAYPQIDWEAFGNNFVNEQLGLNRSQLTTQIEHYDHFGAWCHALSRINTILIDCCRDIWMYVMMEYFKQKIVKGEVGSSAMPHKVNPIDFENAEGNLGISTAIFEHLAHKLPISRLQRDLTDSTVLRNVGVPVAHSLIAFKSILKGLGKLLLNEDAIQNDLKNNWIVVAEGIQTILRREGVPNAYEILKQLTRTNEQITQKHTDKLIDSLELSESIKDELRAVTPFSYVGVYGER